ncbi:DUF4446 family protein [Nocardioides albertanoniae]|uniref:DUF4446 family protein n=1 Tax=Nocardioides albertanoniae TaxID=1175486 RepID=UPI001150F863|nr:DUF4446 family protein [Nocardioides albertanoniae]
MLALGILSLLTAIAALVFAGVGWQKLQDVRRSGSASVESLPTDVAGLRAEVAALRAETAMNMRHVAVVRFDAFGDAGGHLSWCLAMLDDNGAGVVLTSIHGRTEARSYAKSITDWKSSQPLSPEENEAVQQAKPGRRRSGGNSVENEVAEAEKVD